MILALFFAGALLALVFFLLFGGAPLAAEALRSGKAGEAGSGPGKAATLPAELLESPGRRILPRSCPLCATGLAAGERIKSDLSPGTGDRIMRIFGCPHCWPALPEKNARTCPVCGKALPAEGHLLARYFERPGRKHVHVLGCTGCRNPRRE